MFKPVEMRRIQVLVLDNYLDRVMKVLGRLKSVQIKKIDEEYTGLIPEEDICDRYLHLSNRITRLIDLLKIQDDDMGKVSIAERSPEDYLNDIEQEIRRIDDEVIPASERLDEIADEKKVLMNDEHTLECLNKLGVDVKWLKTSEFLYITAGFLDADKIDELESLIGERTGGEYVIQKKLIQDKFLMVVVTLRAYQGNVEGILKGVNFDVLKPGDKDLRGVRDRLKLINEAEEELRSKLNEVRDEKSRDILVAREIVGIERGTQGAMLNFGETDRVYAIEGWAPAREVDDLAGEIDNVSDEHAVIRIYKPKEGENVPVSLNNPKPFKPFETITELFGLPDYTEIDPTPIMAITFPLIFGLMFGDVGHGAILALAGFGMITLKKGDKSAWNFGMILLYCGIAAVIFGFLYGSLCGDEEILPHLYKEWGIGHAQPTEHGEIWVLWKSPPHQIMEMIGIALFIGMLHMSIGLIVNSVNKLHESGLISIANSYGKLWFFCGEVAVITMIFKFPIPVFDQVIQVYPPLTIVLYGLCIPIVLMLIPELLHGLRPFSLKKLLEGLGQGLFEVFETFSMFLSNTISYSRILILALVHAKMSATIFIIMNLVGSPANILIFIMGTILLLVLEGLIVFIHTIRLHFYEWFTKFYNAGGIKYTPFIIERKYTQVNEE